MKHRPDTPEGVQELKDHIERSKLMDAEHIWWERKSPQLSRDITIYPQLLTPEQRERLNQIEQELLKLAHEAEEETRTVLKAR